MPDPVMDSKIEEISAEDAALVRRLVYRKVPLKDSKLVLQILGLEPTPHTTIKYCATCGEPKTRLRHSWRCYNCEKERAK